METQMEVAKKELLEAIQKALLGLDVAERRLRKSQIVPLVVPHKDNMISLDMLGEVEEISLINYKPRTSTLIIKLE